MQLIEESDSDALFKRWEEDSIRRLQHRVFKSLFLVDERTEREKREGILTTSTQVKCFGCLRNVFIYTLREATKNCSRI